VLAHRIGLIPLKIDPNKLQFVENDEETDIDTVVFYLDYTSSTTGAGAENNETDLVYSSELKWVPQGNQSEIFPGAIFLLGTS
jgi:DNA-directed RNA polymerase I and III subunit RPAC1